MLSQTEISLPHTQHHFTTIFVTNSPCKLGRGSFERMETRLVVAYALCAVMALILAGVAVRYFNNRRQFKIRQSGRGKNTAGIDSVAAE
jgi:hypothetical protein